MALPQKQSYILPEQYLAIQRAAESPSEYIDGEMIAMAGASKEHGLIVVAITRLIDTALADKPCVASSGISVAGPSSYLIPDLVVYCNDGDFISGDDILLNPTVIFEVLSNSTDGYDHSPKWMRYQQIASLKYYVLISQNQPMVEIYTRESEDRWNYQVVAGLNNLVQLSHIHVTIALADIYKRVEF